jgi:hypothetical protein
MDLPALMLPRISLFEQHVLWRPEKREGDGDSLQRILNPWIPFQEYIGRGRRV